MSQLEDRFWKNIFTQLPDVWLPKHEYYGLVLNNKEYTDWMQWRKENPKLAAYNDRQNGSRTEDMILHEAVSRILTCLLNRWLDKTLQAKVYDEDDLNDAFTCATMGHYEDMRPQAISQYAERLESRLVNQIYYKGGVYSQSELNDMIPVINIAGVSRNRIIVAYMEKMQSLKPRGQEWSETIKSLKTLTD